jgi:hypothetical protein
MSIEGKVIGLDASKSLQDVTFPVDTEIDVFYFAKDVDGKGRKTLPKNRAGFVKVTGEDTVALFDKDKRGVLVFDTVRTVKGEAINDLVISYNPDPNNVNIFGRMIYSASKPSAK